MSHVARRSTPRASRSPIRTVRRLRRTTTIRASCIWLNRVSSSIRAGTLCPLLDSQPTVLVRQCQGRAALVSRVTPSECEGSSESVYSGFDNYAEPHSRVTPSACERSPDETSAHRLPGAHCRESPRANARGRMMRRLHIDVVARGFLSGPARHGYALEACPDDHWKCSFTSWQVRPAQSM